MRESRCMSLLPRTTLHSDSEQLLPLQPHAVAQLPYSHKPLAPRAHPLIQPLNPTNEIQFHNKQKTTSHIINLFSPVQAVRQTFALRLPLLTKSHRRRGGSDYQKQVEHVDEQVARQWLGQHWFVIAYIAVYIQGHVIFSNNGNLK
jgi:hypothetical protein